VAGLGWYPCSRLKPGEPAMLRGMMGRQVAIERFCGLAVNVERT